MTNKYKLVPIEPTEKMIEKLKESISYNPNTGEFTWVKPTASNVKKGSKAGTLSTYGYVQISFMNKVYFAHRLAWLYTYGKFPTLSIDHVNRIRTDNRIENLREATPSENGCNRKRQSNNTTGFRGVTYDKNRNQWASRIWKDNKAIYLGRFSTSEMAYSAYQEAAKNYHEEFSNV